MCGIIGYAPIAPELEASAAFDRLFHESRVRGLHAFGIAHTNPGGDIRVVRARPEHVARTFCPNLRAIAHTRYSTSGDWQVEANNQPIFVANRMALAFNGVISMGTKAEFEAAFDVQCASDNDGEVFVQRVLGGEDPLFFVKHMTGSFAGVWLHQGRLSACRNARRPLWRCEAYGGVWFASTKDIFVRAGFPPPESVEPLVLEVL